MTDQDTKTAPQARPGPRHRRRPRKGGYAYDLTSKLAGAGLAQGAGKPRLLGGVPAGHGRGRGGAYWAALALSILANSEADGSGPTVPFLAASRMNLALGSGVGEEGTIPRFPLNTINVFVSNITEDIRGLRNIDGGSREKDCLSRIDDGVEISGKMKNATISWIAGLSGRLLCTPSGIPARDNAERFPAVVTSHDVVDHGSESLGWVLRTASHKDESTLGILGVDFGAFHGGPTNHNQTVSEESYRPISYVRVAYRYAAACVLMAVTVVAAMLGGLCLLNLWQRSIVYAAIGGGLICAGICGGFSVPTIACNLSGYNCGR